MTTPKRPPLPLTSDANTLACWPLSGVNPDPDIGPHGWNLTPAGLVQFPAAGSDLLGVGWSIGADAISGLVSANNIAGVVEPVLIGEWTMELMVFLPPGQARWVLLFGGTQVSGSTSQNMLGGIYASATATQTQFAAGWQTVTTGWPFPGNSPLFTALLSDPAPNQWVHVLARKKLNVDAVHYDLSIWVNGVKQADLLAQPNAVGGTNASQRWGVGMWPDVTNGPSTGGDGFVLVDRVKVHSIALSDAAIAQRYADSTWADAASVTQFVSATPGVNYVDLKFDNSLATLFSLAADPVQWQVSGGPYPVTVTAVSLSAADTVRVALAGVKTGTLYTVTIPAVGIKSIGGSPFIGPYNQVFTGQGSGPTISTVQVLDGHHLLVTFSKPVVASEALNPANYGFSPALQLLATAQVSSTAFKLTTAQQDSGLAYTVTASNIHDLPGNSI